MAVEEVKRYFSEKQIDRDIMFLDESSATVALAAKAIGVKEEQIAKTLAFNLKGESIVIVTCGTAKIDNKKFKEQFECKAKMMSFEETLEKTNHPVGGVCPFGLPSDVLIYIDKSLENFDVVYPAAGGTNTAVKVTPHEMVNWTGAQWVDVCKF